jgi:hypothetical protein
MQANSMNFRKASKTAHLYNDTRLICTHTENDCSCEIQQTKEVNIKMVTSLIISHFLDRTEVGKPGIIMRTSTGPNCIISLSIRLEISVAVAVISVRSLRAVVLHVEEKDVCQILKVLFIFASAGPKSVSYPDIHIRTCFISCSLDSQVYGQKIPSRRYQILPLPPPRPCTIIISSKTIDPGYPIDETKIYCTGVP